jgi:hypothetical protein
VVWTQTLASNLGGRLLVGPLAACDNLSVDPDLNERVVRLAVDCWEVAGVPYRHFLCPILLVDDEVPLCKAHLTNQAFNDAPSAWTVQRQDVDNFFGSTVEAEFTTLQDARSGVQFEQLTDPRKRRRLRTSILLDGEPVEHFIPQETVPERFTVVGIESGTDRIPLALKMSEPELAASVHRNWQIELNFDIRYPALAALIKAAFLTQFSLFGYRYALSPAGRFVGAGLLAPFFRACSNMRRAQALKQLPEFFGHVHRMVRPIMSELPGYMGTPADARMFLCWDESSAPWASIVFIPGAGMHSVIMPLSSDNNCLKRYQEFLARDDDATLVVREATFKRQRADRHWEVSPTTFSIKWPKSGDSIPVPVPAPQTTPKDRRPT